MLSRLAIAAVLAVLALAAPGAGAQEVDRIAAVVNDEILSIQDVGQRLRMAMVLSNIPDTPENRRRILPQVVRKMIDERLQLQEAARLKIAMTGAEVEAGLASIEQQQRMPKGALMDILTKGGVDPRAVREQVRADFTWMRVVSRTLRPSVRVGDEEVNDRLETIKARLGQPEYLVAEIFLPVEKPDQEDEMKVLADRLLEQLRGGAPFSALAGQFSRAPTASNGGSMGWVAAGMVDDNLLQAVESLRPGQVSPVVRSMDGFRILALIDRRIAGSTADPMAAMVTLGRIVLPVPPNSPPKEQLMARAQEITRGARSCDELEAIGRKLGATVDRRPPTKVAELDAALKPLAAALPERQVSPPQDIPEGLAVLMVCDRQLPTTFQLPTAEAIRRSIEDERMDMLARRYLRDLRRAAFVDVRM